MFNERLKALGQDKINEIAAELYKYLKKNPIMIGGDKIDGIDLDRICHGYIDKYVCDISYTFADVLRSMVMQRIAMEEYEMKVETVEVETHVFVRKNSGSDDESKGSKWLGDIEISK